MADEYLTPEEEEECDAIFCRVYDAGFKAGFFGPPSPALLQQF